MFTAVLLIASLAVPSNLVSANATVDDLQSDFETAVACRQIDGRNVWKVSWPITSSLMSTKAMWPLRPTGPMWLMPCCRRTTSRRPSKRSKRLVRLPGQPDKHDAERRRGMRKSGAVPAPVLSVVRGARGVRLHLTSQKRRLRCVRCAYP